MKQLAYCEQCDQDVEYITKEETKQVQVRELKFDVKIKVAYCKKCHEQVFPSSFSKENELIIFDEYRRLKHLLTSSEIKAIREKRGMSQRDLARFINCGEKNITRYENGIIQDPAFDYLMRMVGDDEMYELMLKKNITNHSNKINKISNDVPCLKHQPSH